MKEQPAKRSLSVDSLGCFWRLLLILSALVIISLCLVIGTGFYLSNGDPIRQVDALVVLSGDEGDRVRTAARLYQDRTGNYLIITKTDNEEIGEQQTYSEKLMRIAIEDGVPQDAILFTDGIAEDTFAEAQAILTLSQQRNLQSLLVVTGPYHVRRTSLIFRHVFEDTHIKIRVTAVADSWYKPLTWFLSLRGWQQTVSEVLGIIAFRINPNY